MSWQFTQIIQTVISQIIIIKMMKEAREGRFKTIDMSKYELYGRKQKSALSNPHGLILKNTTDLESNQIFPKTAPRQNGTNQFSNRDSGKIVLSPYISKNKQRSHLQALKIQAKAQLQKLTYREKLTQIQHILKTVKQLCKAYGYFSVTEAMLQFHFDDLIKISIWIHPDPRSTRPLHPIKKQTDFQCELVCVSQLKFIIKNLFPNVDIGDGKTLSNLIAHVDVAKAEIDNRMRKQNGLSRKESNKTQQSPSSKVNNFKQNGLIISPKTTPLIERHRTEEDTVEDQNNRRRFQFDQRHKQTTSTLLDSIRSANSIKQKIKFQIGTPNKTKEAALVKDDKKNQLSIEPKSISVRNVQQTFADQKQKNIENAQDRLNKQKISQLYSSQMKDSKLKDSNRLYMKTSQSGKRLMSMSIEIESQINNLFGSNDDMLHSFYSRNPDIKVLKNSVLSKVAEQFQDLF